MQSGEGSFKDGSGTFVQYHYGLGKSYEVIYKDGSGKRTHWYPNGQKKEESNYKDGKQDGKVTYWYEEDGQISSEYTYKDGEYISDNCW